ncbi:MAG TPA: RsmB/NOP family class I SAM-dependent RNA methyltransferase [Stellaceae bacterium]|nr:RsmB/NOP family class I SAM-dependent RNA methyltransferase [Stellaceae bacterium]
MTPGARIEAAILLLGDIEAGRGAADDIVGDYFRRHRFAGAKDRAAISEHIYGVLRHRAQLDWWLERLGGGALARDARRRLLAALVLVEEWRPEAVARACDGDRFRPAPLAPVEARFLDELARHTPDHPEMPDWVRWNYPAWLDERLRALFGNELVREMAALGGAAALDLRVNTLKGERLEGKLALEREGVASEATRYSPLGLRVAARVPLASLDAFRSGLVEVQDEGSQLAALLADARPGMRVVDFCAGAGGKTLALAAQMGNRGHIVACDVSARRIERATQRLRRAGASIVQRQPLDSERDKWVKRHAGSFDRVFIDAPCTGTGTWRRNPDAKWRLAPTDLAELTRLQARILDSACRLAKPGGRLVYATCSLLREENEARIEEFLSAHPDFALLPIAPIWRETVGGRMPAAGDTLRLTPARHGTDGFFVAVLERRADEH